MATIQRFEEIYCWQKARELTKLIYRQFKSLRYKDSGFVDQITRASVSIMSNIAEGFERGTKQEFLNYLYIAKGSAGEVRAQLYVALDAGYLNIEIFKSLNGLAVECSKLLSHFIQSIKTSELKGLQFKKLKKPVRMTVNAQMAIKAMPEMREYYDDKTGEIEYWRYYRDKEKTKG